MPSTKSVQSSASQLSDSATQQADSAIHATQNMANQALDQLSSKVHDVSDQVAPVLNRLTAQAEALTRKTLEAVIDGSKRVRQTATNAAGSTVNYIKEEPVKSVLIAAVAGAALLTIAKFLARNRDHS
jgi:F0F1-type ATP synthase membrane subunit b/b'